MTSFCWLPPDSAAGGDVDAGRAHVELLDDALGVAARGRPVDQADEPRRATGGRVW